MEQAAVVMGVAQLAREWKGRDLMWLCDNIAVVAGLAKGHNQILNWTKVMGAYS